MFLDYSSLTRFNESVKYNLEVNISLLVVKYIILILWPNLVATQNQSIEQWMWLYLGHIRQAIDLKHAAEAFSQKSDRYILQPFLFSCKMLLKWQIWKKRKLIKRILIKRRVFYILIIFWIFKEQTLALTMIFLKNCFIPWVSSRECLLRGHKT